MGTMIGTFIIKKAMKTVIKKILMGTATSSEVAALINAVDTDNNGLDIDDILNALDFLLL